MLVSVNDTSVIVMLELGSEMKLLLGENGCGAELGELLKLRPLSERGTSYK